MTILRGFFKHFAHPQGFWGRVVAWRLNLSNRAVNEWTLSLLDLQPDDEVLEIGFGSGLTLQKAARVVALGRTAGVDASQTMLDIAQKRNAQAINSGRMELKRGVMESLPYPNGCFTKIYAVQVINYLSDPAQAAAELHRVVRPGGRVALFFEDKAKFARTQNLIAGIYQPYDPDEVMNLLQVAGFNRVWSETRHFAVGKVHYTGYCVLAEKLLVR